MGGLCESKNNQNVIQNNTDSQAKNLINKPEINDNENINNINIPENQQNLEANVSNEINEPKILNNNFDDFFEEIEKEEKNKEKNKSIVSSINLDYSIGEGNNI